MLGMWCCEIQPRWITTIEHFTGSARVGYRDRARLEAVHAVGKIRFALVWHPCADRLCAGCSMLVYLRRHGVEVAGLRFVPSFNRSWVLPRSPSGASARFFFFLLLPGFASAARVRTPCPLCTRPQKALARLESPPREVMPPPFLVSLPTHPPLARQLARVGNPADPRGAGCVPGGEAGGAASACGAGPRAQRARDQARRRRRGGASGAGGGV